MQDAAATAGPADQTQEDGAGGRAGGLAASIEAVVSEPWTRMTYREGLQLLQDAEARKPGRFELSGGAPHPIAAAHIGCVVGS